jgi:hypothetical protein
MVSPACNAWAGVESIKETVVIHKSERIFFNFFMEFMGGHLLKISHRNE